MRCISLNSNPLSGVSRIEIRSAASRCRGAARRKRQRRLIMKTRGNKETGGKPFQSAEDFQSFAQEYYSIEFPNPGREGCPEKAMLESLVRSESLPDREMRRHLFSCSNCFSEYKAAMAVYLKTHSLQPVSRWKFSLFDFKLKPLPGLVAAFSLSLLIFFGLLVNHLYRRSQPSTIAPLSSEQISEPADADPNTETNLLANAGPLAADPQLPDGAQSRLPSKSSGRRLRPPPITFAIRIDLREDVIRDAEVRQSDDDKFIELPPRRTSLLIDLPDNSRKGLYEIKIVNSFGKPLISGNGSSRDGKMLKVSLDLRGLAEAKYRLCVSRLGEAPNCYQIMISRTALKR